MDKSKRKYTWFNGEIKEGREYAIAATFDLVNQTVNIGKFTGVKTLAGNVRLNAVGETDVIPLSEFIKEFPSFLKLIAPTENNA